MARTVADAALMLAAMAGADERSPLSYEVDTGEFTRTVRAPSVKGWRIAWTPDLNGLMTIDDEVRGVFERAVTVFRSAGARVEKGSPDFGEVRRSSGSRAGSSWSPATPTSSRSIAPSCSPGSSRTPSR